MAPYHSTLNLIGKTPLVRLSKLSPSGSSIWVKVESQNPGGSIKDRPAFHILEKAYQSGELKKGQPVVEMTSGNMGAGLAVVCSVMGNPLIVVMSRGNSIERVKMMDALGAQVVLVDQVDGAPGQVTGADMKAAVEMAKAISNEKGGYYVDQFNNPGSPDAHERSTGPEIFESLGKSLTAFVSVVGSGGTFVGTARFLKKHYPSVICAAVEPYGAEILAGKKIEKPRHLLQGAGYGVIPGHWDSNLVDQFLSVTDQEAEEFKRRLAHEEGLHVGFTSGANVCAAIKLIENGSLGASPSVATILCDTGLKYS
ncbi:MAG: cysteine synthase family protein [Verrucomicrobiota bacterium]